MSSVRSRLRDTLSLAGEIEFHPLECKALEIWSTVEGPILREYDDLPLDNIIAWIDQTGIYAPPIGNANRCSLRLLYQEWPQEENIIEKDKIPFTKEVFSHLSDAFALSPDYLYLFYENKYTPLYIMPPFSEDEPTTMVFQGPAYDSFSTLSLSYNGKTGVTCGFLGFNQHKGNKDLIKLIKSSLEDAEHPLLVPTIFFGNWLRRLWWENSDQYDYVREIRKVTGRVSNPSTDSNALNEFDEAHTFITHVHDIVNNGLVFFLTGSAANLRDALDKVPQTVTCARMEDIRSSHREIQALISMWKTTLNCEIDVRTRIRERLSMQLQVLYNMMQREDSRRTQESANDSKKIAENSNQIAADTRNDSRVMKDLAEQSKRIAEFTQMDSAAMKTIAAVTMVFLPGTAIATVFSMGPFFVRGENGDLNVSLGFWIYWVLTIPVTIAVVGAWWLWTRKEYNRIRKLTT